MRTVLAWGVVALIAVFVVLNLDRARVWFFGIRAEMPIALVVFVSGAIGLIAGLLLAFVGKTSKKKDAKPAG